jgi:hypothetical protein
VTGMDPKEATPKRPSVMLFLHGSVSDRVLSPILWGLEEEGIPAETREAAGGPAEALAREAAHASMLNVGIGITGEHPKVALHHRDLGQRSPLVSLEYHETGTGHLRRLGANAARLVKGNPLLFDAETRMSRTPGSTDCHASPDLPALVCRILLELLHDDTWKTQGATKSWTH